MAIFFVFSDRHVVVTNSNQQSYIFSLEPSDQIGRGLMGFNMPMVMRLEILLTFALTRFLLQRKWALLSTNETLRVKPYKFDLKKSSIARMTLYVDYMQKTNASETLNTDEMASTFLQDFPSQAFTVGQTVCVDTIYCDLTQLTSSKTF